VKIFDWMATIYRGRLQFSVPIVYTLAFMMLFAIGGLSGIILANPTVDFQVHNTLFLVAHFHNMLIPGLLFGMLAGYTYWFPKVFGFRLNEKWGYVSAFSWTIGFILAFMPLYVVGLMGMTRRTVSYTNPAFQPWFMIALVGGAFVLLALFSLGMQLYVSIRDRDLLEDGADDPWNARTLEWATPSPVPAYNFAIVPTVDARDAYAMAKASGAAYQSPERFNNIHLPGSTRMGVVMAVFGTALGFGLVWYMWWMAAASLAAILVAVLGRSFGEDQGVTIPSGIARRDFDAWMKRIRPAGWTDDAQVPGEETVEPMEHAE
jgi:cytochrome o ubiquinol oxidase subunit 1